jgi:putative acetyltransferase
VFDVRPDDLTGAPTRALVALHHAAMHADSPPEHAFALDIAALRHPDIRVWSAWRDGRIAAIGALRRLADGNGEVKSMRTHPDFLRQGAAAAILATIIAAARAAGARRLSLETGSGDSFAAALALYRAHGFVAGDAFGDYAPSDFNRFFHRDL